MDIIPLQMAVILYTNYLCEQHAVFVYLDFSHYEKFILFQLQYFFYHSHEHTGFSFLLQFFLQWNVKNNNLIN